MDASKSLRYYPARWELLAMSDLMLQRMEGRMQEMLSSGALYNEQVMDSGQWFQEAARQELAAWDYLNCVQEEIAVRQHMTLVEYWTRGGKNGDSIVSAGVPTRT